MLKYGYSNGCHMFFNNSFFNLKNILMFYNFNNKMYIKLEDRDENNNSFVFNEKFKYYDEIVNIIKENETKIYETKYCTLKIINSNDSLIFEFNKKNKNFYNQVVISDEAMIEQLNIIFNIINIKENAKKKKLMIK